MIKSDERGKKMREIEFRGKSKFKNTWVYGKLLNHKRIITQSDDETEEMPCFDMCDYQEEVFENTIGQYTGLKDKNGTKIFEGDILEYEFEDIGKQKAYVDWNGKYASFTLEVISEDFEYAPIESGVIIGNIYDNAELLGE